MIERERCTTRRRGAVECFEETVRLKARHWRVPGDGDGLDLGGAGDALDHAVVEIEALVALTSKQVQRRGLNRHLIERESRVLILQPQQALRKQRGHYNEDE